MLSKVKSISKCNTICVEYFESICYSQLKCIHWKKRCDQNHFSTKSNKAGEEGILWLYVKILTWINRWQKNRRTCWKLWRKELMPLMRILLNYRLKSWSSSEGSPSKEEKSGENKLLLYASLLRHLWRQKLWAKVTLLSSAG